MAEFTVVRRVEMAPYDAWERLTDWERHSGLVPFTTITYAGDVRRAVGERFVARTGVGPLGFDDPMEVTHWEPPRAERPGRCRVEKRGRVMLGWAELTVSSDGSGARAEWREDIAVRGTGRVLDGPNRVAGRYVFGRVVDRLLRDA
jgi:hypothetical protein